MRQSMYTATRLIRIERELREQAQRIKDLQHLLDGHIASFNQPTLSEIEISDSDIKHLYADFHI